jgi:integrase
MVTAKVVTWSRANKDGQFPIGIKISKNGKPSYIFEGYTVPNRSDWDAKKQRVKSSAPNAARITNHLLSKLAEVSDKALELDKTKTISTARIIKERLKPQVEQEATENFTTFKQIADQYLAEQKAIGNYDVFITDRSRLKRFYEFINNRDITFAEITVEFLRRYTLYIRMSQNQNCKAQKTISERTVTNHLVIIRTLYNRAITAKLASLENYPFGVKGGISIKFGKSKKIGLSEMEISRLEALVLPDNLEYMNDTRNLWLTSFYFAGMRITDALLLKWSDFQNGRYYYTMSKTGEAGSLKVSPKVLSILNIYKDDERTHDLVFPHLKDSPSLEDRFALRKRISVITNNLGVHMSKMMEMLEINKNASPHKSRHSFAQRAEEKNIHPKVLQKMYRHESILTTMNYQSNFSHSKMDDALEAVIG